MGKSTNSIEMTEVATMMGAMEALHGCRVSLAVTTLGRARNGYIHTECIARWDQLPGSDLPKEVTVKGDWPSGLARSYEGLCYNLLWQLDYAIQQAYEQMPTDDKA